jgi:hypothetical protein
MLGSGCIVVVEIQVLASQLEFRFEIPLVQARRLGDILLNLVVQRLALGQAGERALDQRFEHPFRHIHLGGVLSG